MDNDTEQRSRSSRFQRCDECGVECSKDSFSFNSTICNECIEKFNKTTPQQESNSTPVTIELQTEAELELQNRANTLLKWGIIFSVVWLAGIGSIIAIILARKAYYIIRQSNNRFEGKGRMWWCFIVGGLGIILWVPIILIAIINNL